MVFLSPYFFSSSIMVEVANAGAGGSDRHTLSEDGLTCVHHLGERMPILFMLPRFGWVGGYTMLGLGDVVLPGLLVCFALRFDLATKKAVFSCRRISYYVLLCIGYATGLMLTVLANVYHITINGVEGQPALLYLVPCTIIPLSILSYCRGEFSDMWNGTPFTHDAAKPRNSDSDEGQNSTTLLMP